MHPVVRTAFEEILSQQSICGPVLEVGACPGEDGLLSLPCLGPASGRTGLNLEAFASTDEITMVSGNAHRMERFGDGQFGCVLSNSMLEHDGRFWRSLAEMRRVLAPGGLMVIGVPGYRSMGPGSFASSGSWIDRGIRLLAGLSGNDSLLAGTVTLGEHFFPGDYYRFSEQACREILLEGLIDTQCRWVMMPPRIIGWGRKPRP